MSICYILQVLIIDLDSVEGGPSNRDVGRSRRQAGPERMRSWASEGWILCGHSQRTRRGDLGKERLRGWPQRQI